MALTKQDPIAPTQDADSYLTLAEWRSRAVELGIELPVDDLAAQSRIITGMKYVDNSRFYGETVIPFQGTAFPRSSIFEYRDGEQFEYPNDKIPQQVIDAVLYVANESVVYKTTQGGQRLKSKKVDVIEKEYFDDGVNSASFVKVAKADALLAPFVSVMSSVLNWVNPV